MTSVVSFFLPCSCASLLDAQPSLFGSGLHRLAILPFEKAAGAVFMVD